MERSGRLEVTLPDGNDCWLEFGVAPAWRRVVELSLILWTRVARSRGRGQNSQINIPSRGHQRAIFPAKFCNVRALIGSEFLNRNLQ